MSKYMLFLLCFKHSFLFYKQMFESSFNDFESPLGKNIQVYLLLGAWASLIFQYFKSHLSICYKSLMPFLKYYFIIFICFIFVFFFSNAMSHWLLSEIKFRAIISFCEFGWCHWPHSTTGVKPSLPGEGAAPQCQTPLCLQDAGLYLCSKTSQVNYITN